MQFSAKLTSEISSFHLLGHPFYQAWMEGKLTRDDLARYASEYFPHVRAFPQFVSAVHSMCEDVAARKLLLENLNDEEGYGGQKNHPQLWIDFAAAFEAKVEFITKGDVGPKAREMVDVFFRLCRSSFEEGLGALYAYEYQVPEIAGSKIEGLKKFYGIEDGEATAFFEVHKSADQFHSAAVAEILNKLSPDQQVRAMAAAKEAGQALWNFLTEVYGKDSYAA